MTTTIRPPQPIHPANAPILDGRASFMHLAPVTRRQLAALDRLIRVVGAWPTREADIATILGEGYDGHLEHLSRGAASYLIFTLQAGLAVVREAEEAGDE